MTPGDARPKMKGNLIPKKANKLNSSRHILVVCALALLSLSAQAADPKPGQKLVAPAPALAPKPAPAPAFKPVPMQKPVMPTMPMQKRGGPPYTVFATPFTVTGTGALAAREAFTPKTFTVSEFTVTGTGVLAAREAFAPKTFTAPAFTVTGTGSL